MGLKYTYVTGESIKNLQYANEKIHHCFFQKATMKFFNSRILHTVYKYNYFITSERFNSRIINANPVSFKRLFTIRQSLLNGEVITVGKFQAYKNRREAEKEIKRLIDAQDSVLTSPEAV